MSVILGISIAHNGGVALICDGKVKIAYLTTPCSRYQLFKILMGLEDGSYINYLN